MKRNLLLACVFAAPLSAQTVKTILNNGPVNNRYDIVILGDGYQAHEQGKFDTDAQNSINTLFAKPSYGAYKTFFNVHTVFRASNQSGADHPDVSPPIVKDTVYDATYNYGGTARCLYIKNTSRANADAQLAPDVEGRVIILVNDTRYGGCASTFAVSYTGSNGPEVQAHEFGHSFGGLADEYDYGRSGTYTGPEPSAANLSADPTGAAKWPLWLGFNGVSAFQGGGYYATGMYRPKNNCLMKSLGVPLCPVCNEQLVKQAYATVSGLENPSPSPSVPVTLQKPQTQVFSISSIVPGNATITWSYGGQQVGTGQSLTFDSTHFSSGRRTLTVSVKDPTSYVRKDPKNLLTATESWSVEVRSAKPGLYTTYGSGCNGSVTQPALCLNVNPNRTNSGYNTRSGVTYALRATAPQALAVTGFELHTASGTGGNANVAVQIYAADGSGKPSTVLGTGSMSVSSTLGWQTATMSSPVSITSGQQFFVAFTSPTTPIAASIVNGTNNTYFRNDAGGGAWTAPISTYAWAYRVQCLAGRVAPSLSSLGAPEIGSAFDVDLSKAVANSAAALLVGASDSLWGSLSLPADMGFLGAPGCDMLSSPDMALSTQTNSQGTASVNLLIPNDPAFVDTTFFNQFVVFDASANSAGLVFSNGGHGKIGKP